MTGCYLSATLLSLLTLVRFMVRLFSSHRPTQSLSIQFRFHCILFIYYIVSVCAYLVFEKDHTDSDFDRERALQCYEIFIDCWALIFPLSQWIHLEISIRSHCIRITNAHTKS